MERRLTPIILLLIGIAALATVGLVILFDVVEHLSLLFFIPLMFLIGAIPIANRIARGTFDLFEVILPYFAMFFLFYGAGALFTLFVEGVAYDKTVLRYLDTAVAYSTLGLACVMLGYFLTSKLVRPALDVASARPGWMALSVLYTAGYIGQLLQAQIDTRVAGANFLISGMTSALSQLQFLSTLTIFYVVFLVMTKRAGPPLIVLLFAWMLPTTIVALLLRVGNKTELILTLGLPFIAFWYARRRIPWKSLTALLLLVVFVIFPLYYGFRNYAGLYYSKGYRLQRTVETLTKQGSKEYTEKALTSVARRIAIINSTAVVIRDCGSRVEFENGRTLWLGVLSVAIPRFLWPDKPSMNIGQWFGRTFHITGFGDHSYISTSMVGELYWNFHIPGIVVGMLVMGAWMSIIYRRFGMNAGSNPFRLAIYVALFTKTITESEGSLGGLEGAVIKEVIVFLVLERVFLLMEGMARHGGGAEAPAAMVPLVTR